MKKRLLPLDDPRWVPLTEAHAELCKPAGSCTFAARDLTKKLREGQIRSMLRRYRTAPAIWGHGPPPPERTLLSEVYWRDHELDWRDRLIIVPSPRRGGNVNFVGNCKFYVWGPDYKKNLGPVATPAELKLQAQEASAKRGRKPVHDRTALTVIAFALAERRKQGEPEKTQKKVVGELREWLKGRGKKAPGDSTLYEIVSKAFRVRAEWVLPKK